MGNFFFLAEDRDQLFKPKSILKDCIGSEVIFLFLFLIIEKWPLSPPKMGSFVNVSG